MDEDALNESLIVDDFTPITHAIEKMEEERGQADGLQA